MGKLIFQDYAATEPQYILCIVCLTKEISNGKNSREYNFFSPQG